jgi:hypothetical protein
MNRYQKSSLKEKTMATKPNIKVSGIDGLISEIGKCLSDVLSQAIQVGFRDGLEASKHLIEAVTVHGL